MVLICHHLYHKAGPSSIYGINLPPVLVEPPQLRDPLVGDEEEPPSLQASCELKEMQDKSRSFCEKNGKVNSSGNFF